MTAAVRGRSYTTRASDVLAHMHLRKKRGAPSMAEAAAFAQQVKVHHDLALWTLLGAEDLLDELVGEGRSTLVADPRPWVAAALQRALAQAMGETYGLQCRSFSTVVDDRELYATGRPAGIRTFQGAEFWFRKKTPNSFFRARVDHTIPRLALPPLTPEIEDEYDAYTLRVCDSVHAVYLLPPVQAVAAWLALCGRTPVHEGSTLLGVEGTRLPRAWCVAS